MGSSMFESHFGSALGHDCQLEAAEKRGVEAKGTGPEDRGLCTLNIGAARDGGG